MLPVITVMLVDDDLDTLDFLEAWLTQSCYLPYRFQILNKAKSGDEAIAKLHIRAPDLVILDLNLPDTPGLTVARFTKSLKRPPKILLYSCHDDWLEWKDSANTYIQGYVVKASPLEKLELAIETILQGDYYWDSAVYQQMHKKLREPEDPLNWTEPLTEREQDVFLLFNKGYKQGQMATELNLSTSTVKTHLQKICKKAGCADLESLRKKLF